MSEPVAWHYPGGSPDQCTTNKEYAEMDPAWTPLYTHPAKTLTDEEIEQIFKDETGFVLDENPMALMDFARAILKKASEK
jgi:hypothetical protein